MLHGLFLEELTIPTFGDDLHRITLGYGPVEFMNECPAYDQTT
jgi:hypothetical protein